MPNKVNYRISRISNRTPSFSTEDNYSSVSWASLQALKDELKQLPRSAKKDIKKMYHKQKRREENIRFLNDVVRRYRKEEINREEFQELMQKEKSLKKITDKSIETFEKMNIESQIRALLKEWILIEQNIVAKARGFIDTKVLGNRYDSTFAPILKDQMALHNHNTVYVEASSKANTRGAPPLEEINSELFKSIREFRPIDVIAGGYMLSNNQSSNLTLSTNPDEVKGLKGPFNLDYLEEVGLANHRSFSRKVKDFCHIS